MEEQIITLFYLLCDKHDLDRILIMFNYNMKQTGIYDYEDNTVVFNPAHKSFVLKRTVRHEFRHYWQRVSDPACDWLQAWNTLSKDETNLAKEAKIHVCEEDAVFYSVHPDLDIGTKILRSVSPEEVKSAALLKFQIPALRKKVSSVLRSLLSL